MAVLDIHRLLAETFVERAEHLDVVDSTNDLARRRAREPGTPLPLLVVADRQTAGRGRGSNRWWTGPGSLAMSLLLPGAGDARPESPLYGLGAAVAVVKTVRPRLAQQSVHLHWPNDVHAADRKLAGVLVEVLSDGRVIVGIGLNSNNTVGEAPPELRGTICTLRDLTGREHDPMDLLIDLIGHLETTLRMAADCPSDLARTAHAMCLQKGHDVVVQCGAREVGGRCEGIASDGALLVRTAQGLVEVRSGRAV